MKKVSNGCATNKGGIINAPKSAGKDSPRATKVSGTDLRTSKKSK